MTTAVIFAVGAVLVAGLAADTKNGAVWCIALLLLAVSALSAWYGADPTWGLAGAVIMIVLWVRFLADLKFNSGGDR